MLSREDIRHLSSGTSGTYIFDLSKIRHTTYEPLLKGLEKFGATSVQKLVFNTELKEKFPDAAELKPMIDYSVVSVVPHYFKRLVSLVKRMIATSKILKEIYFEGIKIPRGEIQVLSEILKQHSSLKLIGFKDIRIHDRDIGELFNGFGSDKIPTITFRNCGLTDDSIEPIINYLSRYSMAHRKRRIPKIDLPGNHISDYGLKQIQRAENVTGNSIISDDSDSSIGIIQIEENESVKSDAKISFSKSRDEEIFYKTELNPSFTNIFDEIKIKNYGDMPDQVLVTENEKLKIQIQRLKLIIDDVNKNDAIYIIGDDAYTMTEYMMKMEQKLNDLQV